ncbi:MAG: carbonic anhydrase [Syntrophomonas sp.]|nr:carbonic anhydrase [Syntrophomonas sp.]
MSHESTKFDLVSLLQELDESLNDYEKGFPLEDFAKGDYQQHPFVTLLTCCDSRVSANMLGVPFNRVFCVENIGNQVNNSSGSVLYGLLHLNTPLMIVAGHSDCGAIKAATSDFTAEPAPLINELTTVKSSLDLGCSGLKADSVSQAQLSELNVDVQVDLLLSNPDIAPRIENSSLQIIGVVVDLHNIYGGGYGKVYTVNVNGEKDAEAIKKITTIGGFAAKAKRLS